MIESRPSIFSRSSKSPGAKSQVSKTQARRNLLQALESAVSIAVSMTLFSLVAFSTFSGA